MRGGSDEVEGCGGLWKRGFEFMPDSRAMKDFLEMGVYFPGIVSK